MRILLLSQWCDPEPFLRGINFARGLTRQGHDVEILTGFPNYPGGKLYDGYRVKPYQCEVLDGITVHRVPLYPSHDKSGLKRAANYASFALSAAAIGPFVVKRPDVIHAYHPPPSIGLAAMTLKARFGVPVIYNIQDMWPDTVEVSGMLRNKKALHAIGLWCELVYRVADRILVLSPGFKKILEDRGVPGDKIDVVYNWTRETEGRHKYNPETAKRLGFEGRFNVLFAGTMGTAQALDSILAASKILAQKKPEVQFVFMGGGVDRKRLEKKAKDEKLVNVRFLPRVEPYQVGPILATADVLLVHLKDDPLFRITIPSKTQAYLAAGKPIIMGVPGDAADLIERSGGGVVVEPENADSIVAGVEKILTMTHEEREEMGRKGREFYDQKLSMAVGIEHFERIFAQVTKRMI